MKAISTTKMTKWAAIAVVCALMLSACGTKPAEKDAASTGKTTQGSSQPATNTQQPAAKKSWTAPPAMTIDVKKTYQATVATSKGSFKIDLYAKDAPLTVNNFVFLAKEGFYNDIVFHRIIESFMIQTGDPLGVGSGGPGYSFQDELKTPYKYEPGIVAMANAGPNTNGSQFFICTGEDSKNLNKSPNYTIFGKVTEGMDIVKKIAATPVTGGPSGEKSTPTEKVVIQSVAITEK
ncbi:Peptidyl-prolyl cis-trans isomerase (rotamase)-cyclophilin family [Paenibacillus sp. 1_12]|uniref:peptidylprolyl isomerase n=1 Tax=Paenibacillus sp. 1_12 TaxID=1566278 RepID=UPI0008DF55FA|nr:peptidylprolyl isomerase [Paenibacillus sp. 1_12]SFL84410.1 Peptidyl-prolyl cis-trans isomerase (rotamase)-cyclophilin family [Paenibacillus sp. 1_12]